MKKNTNVELPAGHTENAVESVEAAAPEAAAPAAESIVIDGQEFASESAAFEYLKSANSQKDIELKIALARQEGIEAALAQVPGAVSPQATATPAEEDETEIWEDPKAYVAKKLAEQDRKWEQRMQQQQTDAQVWNEFTSRHPHLSGFRSEVEALASQYPDQIRVLAKRDPNSAYDFVANKLTEKFKTYASAVVPARELSNTSGGPSVGNSNRSVTPSAKTEKNEEAMDMASQLRSIRYR